MTIEVDFFVFIALSDFTHDNKNTAQFKYPLKRTELIPIRER